MNMNPTLQFSILCDDVRREDNGKFMFLGLFETIGGAKFPIKHPRFYVSNRWCKGAGTFIERIRIFQEEAGKTLIESKPTTFELKGMQHYHTTINRFNGVSFPSPGKYLVEVLLNDDLMISYPIMLRLVKPQSQPKEDS